jgi:3',5'-cyclic-AMP phosphodiesterase
MALTAEHRSGLARVLERHPQVQLLTAGHLPRAITARFAGRPLLTVPSTHAQARLQFEAPELELTRQPPAYAIHAVVGDEIVSHLQPVEPR